MADRFLLLGIDQAKRDPQLANDPTIRDGYPDRQVVEDAQAGRVRFDPDQRPVLVDRKTQSFVAGEPPDRPTSALAEVLAADIAALEARVAALEAAAGGGGRP